MPCRTTTQVTHYHVQKKRRAEGAAKTNHKKHGDNGHPFVSSCPVCLGEVKQTSIGPRNFSFRRQLMFLADAEKHHREALDLARTLTERQIDFEPFEICVGK